MDITLLLRLSLLGASTILGLLLAFALAFLKKGNRKANILLVVIVLIYVSFGLNNFMMYSGLYKTFPHYILSTYPLTFLIGFIFFLYTRFLTKPDYQLKWHHVFHLIPLVYIYYMMRGFYSLNTIDKINTLTYLWFGDYTFSFSTMLTNLFPSLLIAIYLIVAFVLIKQLYQKLNNETSNTHLELAIPRFFS